MRMRHSRLARAHEAYLLALALVLCATGATAAEPQDLQWTANYKGWEISSFELSGVDEDLASDIRKGLTLAGQRKLIRRQRALFYLQTAEEDIERTRLFLARHGYPYAVVSPHFKPNPEKRKVEVTFAVRQGPLVTVSAVHIEGFPPSMEREANDALSIRPGSALVDDKVEEARVELEYSLRNAGYARAQVASEVDMIDSTSVSLTYDAEPGTVCYYASHTVEGVREDLVPVVDKTVDLDPGTRFSPDVAKEAEDYLRLLGLFSRIRLEALDAGEDSLNLHIALKESKPQTYEVNVGYWTDELFKVRARWVHRNLFKGGRKLEVEGSYSKYARTFDVSHSWPTLFGARTWGIASAGLKYEREESYDQDSKAVMVAGTYQPSLETVYRAGISLSDVNVEVKTEEEEAFQETGGLITAFSLQGSRDTSDDRLNPTRGRVAWTRIEWAPHKAISESQYILFETSGASYVSLKEGTVLALRLGLGWGRPLGESSDLLPDKRFYAGGAASMRGFKRRKLGPLDESGVPLGGEFMLAGSMELRFPIVWKLEGATFMDAGQVWKKRNQASLDELEFAVGPGLMIQTPIGPIRLDWGYRLTDLEKTQPRSVFHLNIGHPF